MADAQYTTKQMSDACEMIVAGELTLHGIPALKVPDNWPEYDVIAQPPGRPPQRIQVKSRTFKKGGSAFITYPVTSSFDWIAVVPLQCPDKPRRVFLIPRSVADKKARQDSPKTKTNEHYWPIEQTEKLFPEFEAFAHIEPNRKRIRNGAASNGSHEGRALAGHSASHGLQAGDDCGEKLATTARPKSVAESRRRLNIPLRNRSRVREEIRRLIRAVTQNPALLADAKSNLVRIIPC